MKITHTGTFVLFTLLVLQPSIGSLSIAQAPPEDVGRITVADLKAKLDAGQEVTVVDVRSKGAFDIGHIPNAVSIPTSDIPKRHQELKEHPLLVLY